MLFDERPKESLKDFFDMRDSVEKFIYGVKSGRAVILVLGLRRTGKTSLVKSCLNELGYPYIMVDLKGFWGRMGCSLHDLYVVLEESINKYISKWKRVIDYFKSVEGVSVLGFNVRLKTRGRHRFNFISFLHSLDSIGRDYGRFILVFDEAQLLRSINGFDITRYISYAYDNLRYLTIVLTGSEIGLLYDVLRIDDPCSPLYGRYLYEVYTRRFSRRESIEFLKRGFSEYGFSVPDSVIEEAVELLDGVPGWLTLYGSMYVVERSRDVVYRVLEKASQIVYMELEKFLTGREIARKRYAIILKTLAEKPASWSEIKRAIEYREGRRISDRSLYNLLQNLIKTCMISKKDNKYYIVDPILRYTVKTLLKE